MEEKELAEDMDMVEDLEKEVDHLETEFESVSSEDASSTTREKQQKVQEILEEVHEQIAFLKEVSENEKGSKDDKSL